MKSGIHPTWYSDCQVTCSCGNVFVIGSINQTLQVDICNKCHPFFTGEMRFVDRQGRVDRFNKKVLAAAAKVAAKTSTKKGKKATDDQEEAKTYKEILQVQQSNLRKVAREEKKAA